MKKAIIAVAMFSVATFGYAQDDSKNQFKIQTEAGTVFDFNAAQARIQELNQSIEAHKAGIEQDKADIIAVQQQIKDAHATVANATKVVIPNN